MQAMAKDPDDRYPTPRALGADLQRFLHFEPVAASPRVFRMQTRLFMRRNRKMLASLLLVVCAAFALTGFLVDRRRQIDRERTREVNSLLHEASNEVARAEEDAAWAVRFGAEEMPGESGLWEESSTDHLDRARRAVEKAADLEPENERVARLGAGIRVKRFLHRYALARARGMQAEAGRVLGTGGGRRPRGDEDLIEACRERVTPIASRTRCRGRHRGGGAGADRGRSRDTRHARGPRTTTRSRRKGPGPSTLRDRQGKTLKLPVYVAPSRYGEQRISVPLSATRLERDHPGMALIPGSLCILGSDWDESPAGVYQERIVYVEPFLMARFEVTNEEYLDFVNDRRAFSRQVDLARRALPEFAEMSDRRPLLPQAWKNSRPAEGSERMPVQGREHHRGARLRQLEERSFAA